MNLTDQEINFLLADFDRAAPADQRRAVARLIVQAAAMRKALRYKPPHDQLCPVKLGGNCCCGVEDAERDRQAALAADAGRELLDRLAKSEEECQRLRRELAKAAEEIPCAGPVDHRIRVLRREFQDRLAALEAENAGLKRKLATAAERIAAQSELLTRKVEAKP